MAVVAFTQFVLLASLLLPCVAAAQTTKPGEFPALPPIGLPLPPIGLPAVTARHPVKQPPARNDSRRSDRHRRHVVPTAVVYVPVYPFGHSFGHSSWPPPMTKAEPAASVASPPVIEAIERLEAAVERLEAAQAPEAQAPRDEPTPSAEPASPVSSTPIYLIPGCYLGNVAPESARLPASCDTKRVVTVAP
jgi:hypothetical protein